MFELFSFQKATTKKDHYSVQDGMNCIQNGGSDSDMESDDTDASDKEADEDGKKWTKKNNHPL